MLKNNSQLNLTETGSKVTFAIICTLFFNSILFCNILKITNFC